jgi:hypothetical protein
MSGTRAETISSGRKRSNPSATSLTPASTDSYNAACEVKRRSHPRLSYSSNALSVRHRVCYRTASEQVASPEGLDGSVSITAGPPGTRLKSNFSCSTWTASTLSHPRRRRGFVWLAGRAGSCAECESDILHLLNCRQQRHSTKGSTRAQAATLQEKHD